MKQKPTDIVFRFPNDEQGKYFLSLCRKYLNIQDFKLKPRANYKDRKGLAKKLARKLLKEGKQGYWHGEHSALRQEVPLKYADEIRLYIRPKPIKKDYGEPSHIPYHYYNRGFNDGQTFENKRITEEQKELYSRIAELENILQSAVLALELLQKYSKENPNGS